jgi:hypothetical protein
MGFSGTHRRTTAASNYINELRATAATAARPPHRTAAFNNFKHLRTTAGNRRNYRRTAAACDGDTGSLVTFSAVRAVDDLAGGE